MLQRLVRDIPAKFLVATAAAAAFVAGCSDGPTLPSTTGAAAPVGALQRTYRLGIGDKLKLTVFGEENLSGQFEVNALGQVALPLIGELPPRAWASASSATRSPAGWPTAISRTRASPSRCSTTARSSCTAR